jgi:hypothetical protein
LKLRNSYEYFWNWSHGACFHRDPIIDRFWTEGSAKSRKNSRAYPAEDRPFGHVEDGSTNIKEQLPNELIREADLEEIKKSFAQTSAEIGNLNPGGLSPFHSKPTPGQENDAVLDPPTSEPVSPNKKEGL